jgi:hypothetical protein
MKRAAKLFGLLVLVLVGVLALGYGMSILWFGWIGPYDRFYPYELRVSSPKSAYAVGENIELNYEIRSKGRARIRLFKDRSKSLNLFVRSSHGNVADLEDNDFYQHPRPSRGGEIEVIRLDADNPFRMTVKGVITKDSERGGIILDFGEFGRFRKNVGTCLIGGFWRPIHPEPFDSLEDFTNTIVVEFRDPQESTEGIKSSKPSAPSDGHSL